MSEFQAELFESEGAEIDPAKAHLVINVEEGQFSDAKAIAIAPAKLTRTICAFANTDGGDLYIGVSEDTIGGNVKKRRWNGFPDIESANGHLQPFEKLFPLGREFQYQFFRCPNHRGLVLHVQVARSRQVIIASDGIPYIRRGAQNIPQKSTEEIKRLEFAKGVSSFETQPVQADKELLTDSDVTKSFLINVIPDVDPEKWLKKQGLITNDMPTVAGLLLFAEEPQGMLPKHCGIKVYRYATQEQEGFRDVLVFTPKTVEGCLYDQIRQAVELTRAEAEKIPHMGESGLEKITYPPEALHEIITNAVIHRDYSIADDIHVRIFDNRIEIQSPGKLPAHVTPKNILNERFARNGAVVRLLNKFPDPPNKDVGEGLNTAFEKMHELGLREPEIEELATDVLVTIRHESLASPEQAIMEHLENNESIRNNTAREITHIKDSDKMKRILRLMASRGEIEKVPGTRFGGTAYRKKEK